ncbi:MAG: DNA-processing protein DprA [Gemmatimonadota bacterium]
MTTIGRSEILEASLLGIIGARMLPAELILPSFDLARTLRQTASAVVAGFQTAVEREILRILLAGDATIVICPARGLEGMRIPRTWRRPLQAGRLLIASRVGAGHRRPTAATAAARNRLVLELASTVWVLHAYPGSRTFALATAAVRQHKPVYCFDHPCNRDLVLLGAEPAAVKASSPAFHS